MTTSETLSVASADYIPAETETLCAFGDVCLHRITVEGKTLFALSTSDCLTDADTSRYYASLPAALHTLFLEAIQAGNESAHELYDFVAGAERSRTSPLAQGTFSTAMKN